MSITRAPRTLTLDGPLAAEDLWRTLAGVLPVLVRMFVPEGGASLSLPELRGPTNLPDRRRYDCSERGSFGHLDLFEDGSVALSVTQRTVSNGLAVLQIWTSSAAAGVTDLQLGCHPDDADAVFALVSELVRPVKPRENSDPRLD